MTDKTIEQIINELVESKTFTLEAVEAVNEIRKKAADLEEKNRTLLTRLDTLREIERKLDSKILTLDQTVESQRKRIEELEAKVKSLEPAGYRAEKHEAVAAAYRYALETVFRPAKTRQVVIDQPPAELQPSQYPGAIPTYTYPPSSTTTTETEEL